MFRRILVSAVLAAGVMMECDGAGEGDINTPESIRITERSDFFNLNREQIENCKEISLYEQNFDRVFLSHWNAVFGRLHLVKIMFDTCNFSHPFSLQIFNGICVDHISLRNCNIDPEMADQLLRYVCPYCVRFIDFSNNRLHADEELFWSVLKSRVLGMLFLDFLGLAGNELSEEFISRCVDSDNRSKLHAVTRVSF